MSTGTDGPGSVGAIVRAVKRDQRRKVAEGGPADSVDDPAPVHCGGCSRCDGRPRTYACTGMYCGCSVH